MKNGQNSFDIKEDESISKESKILSNQNYFDNSINISEIESKENEHQRKYDLNDENSIYSNLEDQSINQLNKEIIKKTYKKK